MNAAMLLVRCLEQEGVRFIFGVPGEETLALTDALLDARIQVVVTRHEQAAAFMADVYGRLSGQGGRVLFDVGAWRDQSDDGRRRRLSRSRSAGDYHGASLSKPPP